MPRIRPIPMTVAVAALTSGLSVQHIRRECARGRLKATKFGRDWLIAPVDLERFMASARVVGRPRIT